MVSYQRLLIKHFYHNEFGNIFRIPLDTTVGRHNIFAFTTLLRESIQENINPHTIHTLSTNYPRLIHIRSAHDPRLNHDLSTIYPRSIHDPSTIHPHSIHDSSTYCPHKSHDHFANYTSLDSVSTDMNCITKAHYLCRRMDPSVPHCPQL